MDLPATVELPPRPFIRIPAWGMSLALHLALLLLIACWVTPERVPKGPPETDRSGSIVLVASNLSPEKQYLSEDELASASPAGAMGEPLPGVQSAEAAAAQEAAANENPGLAALLPTRSETVGSPSAIESATTTSGRSGSKSRIPSIGDGSGEADLIAREQARYRPKVHDGPPTKVSLFGSPAAEGRTFTFVLDRSASTGADGLAVLESAEKQLITVVSKLSATHRFQIIAYNEHVQYLGPKQMTPATQENKTLVAPFMQSIAAYGATNHEMALKAALRAKPDVVFLLTDGGDPFLTPGEMRDVLEMAGRTTSIHCIQFGVTQSIPEGEAFMKKLSGATGGSYTFLDVNK